MARPVIGIAASRGGVGQQVDGRYVTAVEQAGGAPLIVPVTARVALEAVVERLDGLVIPGGAGITAGLVGHLPGDLGPEAEDRVQSDRFLFSAVQQRGQPILGICYGMQLINACMGGTIYADASAQLGVANHSTGRNQGAEVRHPVEVVAATHLARLTGGGKVEANSYHIQAVDRLGAGLQVSARSDDGLVEGLESEDGLLMGVQFHPERMPGTVWEQLFAHLVSEAQAP